MTRARALFPLLGLVAAACSSEAPLPVAQNVDLSRMQGQWFEIAKLPRVTQTDCYGTTASYTLASDGSLTLVNQCNVGGATGAVKSVTMRATAPDSGVPSKLSLDVGGFTGDYWILEVGSQYEYAVIGHPSRAYLWIMSRTTTLDPSVTQGILSRAQANQFDTSKLEYTPQAGGPAAPQGNVLPAQGHGCAAGAPPSRGSWLAVALALAAALGRRRRAD
jgi:apolipoprotein D and lipocalin family protein